MWTQGTVQKAPNARSFSVCGPTQVLSLFLPLSVSLFPHLFSHTFAKVWAQLKLSVIRRGLKFWTQPPHTHTHTHTHTSICNRVSGLNQEKSAFFSAVAASCHKPIRSARAFKKPLLASVIIPDQTYTCAHQLSLSPCRMNILIPFSCFINVKTAN